MMGCCAMVSCIDMTFGMGVGVYTRLASAIEVSDIMIVRCLTCFPSAR